MQPDDTIPRAAVALTCLRFKPGPYRPGFGNRSIFSELTGVLMTYPLKKITVPLTIKSATRNNAGQVEPADPHVESAFASAIQPVLRDAVREGWIPCGRTDFRSLWAAGLVQHRLDKGFMGTSLAIDGVTLYLRGRDDGRVTCVQCQADCSLFDVFCVCGAYLPDREVDFALRERLFEQFEEYERWRAAAAQSAQGSPSLGGAIARGALLGLVGGVGAVASEIGKDIQYERLEKTIARAIKRAS
jgi:hypothetical protein